MKMKRLLFGLLVLLILASSQTKTNGEPNSTPTAQTDNSGAAGGSRAREFQSDDLDQVLRLLARQAKINLVVADGVSGKVSMRLEDKTAMDAIEIIARANKLTLTKDDKGVYYVSEVTEKHLPDVEVKDADENATEDGGEALAGKVLGFLIRPATADHVAKYKRNLFNALVKEGFTPDQAIQIVAADRTALEIAEHFDQ